jgi:vacuolar protein 8
VDAAVLEPLLHLLRSSDDVEVQRAASAALGNLAVNVANKLKIVRLGGLEPLVKQMLSPNVEVQCNAVGCITNLATHEENKSAIALSGALVPLTKLAKTTKDIRVQRNATGALLNMTHSEENRRELVEAGAIPVLVTLLKSSDVDVVYYCTTALSNLAVDGKCFVLFWNDLWTGRKQFFIDPLPLLSSSTIAVNRRKLGQEPRLVGELVDLMESPSLKVQCQSALALRNLASDERYQLEIAEHPSGLARLLGLLRGVPTAVDSAVPLTPSNGANGQVHPQLVLASVACIRNISIHPNNETRIIDAGFLKPLVELLAYNNEEVQCHAISTLRNLAAGNGGSGDKEDSTVDNKEKIVASGAVERIKLLIDEGMDGSGARLGWPVLSEMTACLAVLALSGK